MVINGHFGRLATSPYAPWGSSSRVNVGSVSGSSEADAIYGQQAVVITASLLLPRLVRFRDAASISAWIATGSRNGLPMFPLMAMLLEPYKR